MSKLPTAGNFLSLIVLLALWSTAHPLFSQEAPAAPAKAPGPIALDIKPDIEKGPNDSSRQSPAIFLTALEGGGIQAECYLPTAQAQSFGFTKSLEPAVNTKIVRFEANNESGSELKPALQFYDSRMKYYLLPFDMPSGGWQPVEINIDDGVSLSDEYTQDPPQQPLKKVGIALRGEFNEGSHLFQFRNFSIEPGK